METVPVAPANGVGCSCNGYCLMVKTVFELDEPAKGIAQFRAVWRSTFQRVLGADHIDDAETKASSATRPQPDH